MKAGPVVQAVVRLVPPRSGADPAPRRRCYRPLVVGPALLRRSPGAGRWTVAVSNDGRLLPLAAASLAGLRRAVARHEAAGLRCRIATALASPADMPRLSVAPVPTAGTPSALRSEIYGWAIMYQPAGVTGRAFVDADGSLPDLPACFELPLELLDRIAFLEARGIRTRPLAVITRPEDFEPVGGRIRNRFRPDARFRRPFAIDRLL